MTNKNSSSIGKTVGGLALASFALLGAMKTTERQVLHVYPDHLAKGLPTFCSGATDWNAKIGTVFTQAQCDAVDAATAEKYNRGVLSCVKSEHLNQGVFDAFTLFFINVGISGGCGSRAVKLLNQGLIKDACRAVAFGPDGKRVWVFAGGKFVRGLANRRDFESNWCLRETGVL